MMSHEFKFRISASRALLMLAIAAMCMNGCESTPSVLILKPHDKDLLQLAWLAGSWITEPSAESPTINPTINPTMNEEHWMQPSGGSMIGMNRTQQVTGGGTRTVFFEYLRIQHSPAGVTYLASPKGRQPPTPFNMIECTANQVTFENPQHDFPSRIIYRREGNLLFGRIEGEQNGKPAAEEWTWRRARIE